MNTLPIINIQKNAKIVLLILSMIFFCNTAYCNMINARAWEIKGNPKKEIVIVYRTVDADHILTENDIHYIDFREFNKAGRTVREKRNCGRSDTFEKIVNTFNENNNLLFSERYDFDGIFTKTIFETRPFETRRLVYDADGNLIRKTVRVYDEKGRLIEHRFADNRREVFRYVGNITYKYTYCADGKLKWYISEERDNMGRIIVELQHTTDGEIISKRQSEFDRRGNIVSYRRYWVPENNLQTYMVWLYNRRGHLIESKSLVFDTSRTTYRRDRRGNLLEKTWYRDWDNHIRRWIFTYNRAGLLIEQSLYKDGALFERITYEYDAVRNWIKKTNFCGDNRKTVTKREIQYYEHSTHHRR